MALFSFSDISFESLNRAFDTGVQFDNAYKYNIYRFPSDVGNTDRGHYMVININKQRSSEITGVSGLTETGDLPTVISNRLDFGIPTFGSLLGSAFGDSTIKSIADWAGASGTYEDFSVSFTRTTKRVQDTIALFMPDTLLFQQNQGYSDLELTGKLAALTSAGGSVVDTIMGASLSNMGETLKKLGGNLSPALATKIRDNPALYSSFVAFTGKTVNPMLELIYTSPEFRTFQFDFKMCPRDEKEAAAVQDIINKLYFHQAPEISKQGQGFFLVPPSEFDLSFYYNGKVNPNIPKISTCVLTGINVNYAPNGFTAYEVQGETSPQKGRTGMPVTIELSLFFKETEVMTKDNYKKSVSTSGLNFGGGSVDSPYVTGTPYTTTLNDSDVTTPLGD